MPFKILCLVTRAGYESSQKGGFKSRSSGLMLEWQRELLFRTSMKKAQSASPADDIR